MPDLTVIDGGGEKPSPPEAFSERHKPASFCPRAAGRGVTPETPPSDNGRPKTADEPKSVTPETPPRIEPPPDLEVCQICGVPHRDRCRLLGRHLRHLELLGRSPVTVYERKRMIIRLGWWCAKQAPPVAVADATAEQLYSWREGLRVADATAAGYVSHVKGFYSWMAGESIREDDPSAQIPAPKTPRRLPRPISEEDLMRALEAAPERIRLMIVLMAWCGLRCQEVARLQRQNIRDTAANPVLVVVIGAAKGKKERAIPMSEFVVAEVLAANLPKRGYVFPRHDSPDPVFYGNQHQSGLISTRAGALAPYMVSKLIGAHLRNCGIAATAHQLRHRFGTVSYGVSEDLLAVRDLMGHADVSTTSVYVLVNARRGAEVVNKLPVPPKLRVVKDDPA